jgi:choline transport protein
MEPHRDIQSVEEGTPLSKDDLDLLRAGHKPILERNFSFFSLLAFAFVVVDAWNGLIASLATGIDSGGTVMLIYGTLLVSFFTMFVALSLGEMAGAYPTSGGEKDPSGHLKSNY